MRRHAFTTLIVATAVIAVATFGGFDDYAQTEAGLGIVPYAEPVTPITVPATTTTVPAITVPLVQPLPPAPTTVPAGVRCPEWWHTLTVFWPADLWLQADQVMWAETRCQNLHRSNRGGVGFGDHGLFQINAINLDYLAGWGITAADLMVPAMNMVAALILYRFADMQYGCGWQPWYSSVDYRAMCDAVQH